ncbi:MAG: synthase subunit [Actinomycetota bacterium]
MHYAVVQLSGNSVRFVAASEESGEATTASESSAESTKDPSKPGPIVPELKEIYWGAGSFVVFAILMRLVLYPRLKRGMQARYDGIRTAHETADAERAKARAEVAEYEAQLASIKAEASRKVEAARASIEAERTDAIAKLNARLTEQRSAAAAQVEAARSAAASQIREAVSDVAGRAGELATGKRPSPEVVSRVVQEVMSK